MICIQQEFGKLFQNCHKEQILVNISEHIE